MSISNSIYRTHSIFLRRYASAAASRATSGNAASTAAAAAAVASQARSSVASTFRARVQRFEHKDVLVAAEQELRFTYTELQTHSDAFAHGLITGRHRVGDTALCYLPLESEAIVTYLGLASAGVRHVCAPPEVVSQHDVLASQLAAHSASIVVVTPSHGVARNHIEDVRTVIPEAGNTTYGDVLRVPKLRALRRILQTGQQMQHGFDNYRDFFIYDPMPSPLPPVLAQLSASTPHVTYLGAKTATPYAQLTHGASLKAASRLGEQLSLGFEDRVCISEAVDHAVPHLLALACIDRGSVAVLATRIFDPVEFIRIAASEHCTVLQLSSDNVDELLDCSQLGKSDLSAVRAVLISGELSGDSVAALSAAFPDVSILSTSWNSLLK